MTAWAAELAGSHPEIERVGYFGSYARGDWGVGSDVDLVILVEQSSIPFIKRSVAFDATRLPVPADVLVYTSAEWDGLARSGRFGAPRDEMKWVYVRRREFPDRVGIGGGGGDS